MAHGYREADALIVYGTSRRQLFATPNTHLPQELWTDRDHCSATHHRCASTVLFQVQALHSADFFIKSFRLYYLPLSPFLAQFTSQSPSWRLHQLSQDAVSGILFPRSSCAQAHPRAYSSTGPTCHHPKMNGQLHFLPPWAPSTMTRGKLTALGAAPA